MLSSYLPEDVCGIVKEYLMVDYIHYKIYCNILSKYITVWSSKEIKKDEICPNCNNHNILYITISGRMNSNGKIIMYENTSYCDKNIEKHMFSVINI